MKKRIPLFIACSLFLPSMLIAQVFRGTIQGRITDPSGGTVPGATITATNVSTNVLTKATSNPEGNYMIQFLDEGDYSVAVEQPGFKQLVRPGRVNLFNSPSAISLRYL
ncbi:MAG: carboxypeptidase-like regulatory domain-containing protein [Terriglobia bacterium]